MQVVRMATLEVIDVSRDVDEFDAKTSYGRTELIF